MNQYDRLKDRIRRETSVSMTDVLLALLLAVNIGLLGFHIVNEYRYQRIMYEVEKMKEPDYWRNLFREKNE